MRISIVLALIVWIFLSSAGLSFARETDIGYSKIHPASPFYFFKSFKEVLELKFAKSDQIGLKYFEFANRRIRETVSLSLVNRVDLIPPTLEKYYFNLNKSLGHLNFRNIPLSEQIISHVGMHIVALKQIYYQNEDPRAKIALRTAIYRISQWNEELLEKLSQEERNKLAPEITQNQSIICDFLYNEASGSALNDTERVVLISRAKVCLQNLGANSF